MFGKTLSTMDDGRAAGGGESGEGEYERVMEQEGEKEAAGGASPSKRLFFFFSITWNLENFLRL